MQPNILSQHFSPTPFAPSSGLQPGRLTARSQGCYGGRLKSGYVLVRSPFKLPSRPFLSHALLDPQCSQSLREGMGRICAKLLRQIWGRDW